MAAKKEPFSIASKIDPEKWSNLDTSAAVATVVNVPINSIQINEKNFYDTSNVKELVNSIALNGLLEPIIVMPTEPIPGAAGPAYRIISGHRRFSAWQDLASENPEKYAAIPAIVRTPANEIMEELMLIEANRATRVMSSADTMKQAERYKELLVKLKEQGVEIPGRMRDVLADAMQISTSRLARLDVIRKNLCTEAMSKFEHSAINESVAYELAQAPYEAQEKILSRLRPSECEPSWRIKEMAEWMANLEKIHCTDERPCENRDRMFAEKCKDSSRYAYLQCAENGKCCKDCSKLFTCKSACKRFEDKIKKHAADEARKNAKEASEAETRKLNQIAENNKQWFRLGYARQKAGIKYDEIYQALRDVNCYSWPSEKIMNQYENCDCDDSWGASILRHLTANELAAVAKLYKCSADYLLGLSSELASCSTSAKWRSFDNDPPAEEQEIIVIYSSGELAPMFYRTETFDGSKVINWFPFPEVP